MERNWGEGSRREKRGRRGKDRWREEIEKRRGTGIGRDKEKINKKGKD